MVQINLQSLVHISNQQVILILDYTWDKLGDYFVKK